jgi:uncharacterized membrane protein (DUF2068 family)
MATGLPGLRTVAVFEAAKGLAVLAAAGLFVRWMHHDVQAAVDELVRHFHMNPARHNPGVFIATLVDYANGHLLALSLGAAMYAGIRFVEAYGLWRGYNWAWGFGIISAALYIPFELVEISRHVTWGGFVVLVVNVLVVIVLWLSRAR